MDQHGVELCGAMLEAYTLWVRGRVVCMRDWLRCGERRRVALEARMLSSSAAEMGLMELAYTASQVQVAATLGASARSARQVGRLMSQVERLEIQSRVMAGPAPFAQRMAA